MTRPSHSEMIAQAGFLPGEVEASRNLRAAVCNGTASAEDQLAYGKYAPKWDKFAELMAERDQADRREAAAPDPARHTGDDALGAAFRAYRDGQPPPRTVIRPRLIAVDTGNGAMIDVPEAPEWPLYRGSAGSSGHERIAAGLSANKKR